MLANLFSFSFYALWKTLHCSLSLSVVCSVLWLRRSIRISSNPVTAGIAATLGRTDPIRSRMHTCTRSHVRTLTRMCVRVCVCYLSYWPKKIELRISEENVWGGDNLLSFSFPILSLSHHRYETPHFSSILWGFHFPKVSPLHSSSYLVFKSFFLPVY